MGPSPPAARRVSEAFYAFSALTHVYGAFIFIFFHEPKATISGKDPARAIIGGAAMLLAVAYFLQPKLRPTAASSSGAAIPAAARWLIALVPLVASPYILFPAFTIFGAPTTPAPAHAGHATQRAPRPAREARCTAATARAPHHLLPRQASTPLSASARLS